MRGGVKAFIGALLTIASWTVAASAQIAGSGQPAFETEPFSGPDLISGKRISEQQCAGLAGAVWVVVNGRGDCIRYYYSGAGGGWNEAIVFFSADLVLTNGRGESKPVDYYLKETAAEIGNGSVSWSRALRMPYVLLARPGTYGSSGEHSKRRTPQEIELLSAALDAIKARHGFTRLHLAGASYGAHAPASLLARRTDVGCAVLASGFVAVKMRLAEFGKTADITGNKNPVDPIGLVDQIAKRPDLKIYVLTDPDDVAISARSQTAYVRRLSAAGLQVRQIFASASDVSRHQLSREARLVAAACAKGVAADTIVAMYQNKVPSIPPDADEPPLHKPDVLSAGLALTEDQCKKLDTAVWTRVDGRGSCVRYWIATAGGKQDEALIYLHGDIGGRDSERSKLKPYQTVIKSSDMQRGAQAGSRIYAGPYLEIGRPGAFGSSGNHLRDRRTGWEIGVLMQALDVLKERYHFTRLHLIGQSGGGHDVAALVQKRDDIGCAVMASGSASVRTVERDRGNNSGKLKPGTYDPIDFVDRMRHQPGRRLIVLSDPDDKIVSFHSQREFVERIKGKGVPILHISAAAGDEDFHGLVSEGRRVATDCAQGMDDAALIAKYQNKTTSTLAHSAARRAR